MFIDYVEFVEYNFSYYYFPKYLCQLLSYFHGKLNRNINIFKKIVN